MSRRKKLDLDAVDWVRTRDRYPQEFALSLRTFTPRGKTWPVLVIGVYKNHTGYGGLGIETSVKRGPSQQLENCGIPRFLLLDVSALLRDAAYALDPDDD